MNLRGPYSPRTFPRKPRRHGHPHNPVMKIRTRKLIGTFGLLGLVILWSLAGMAIAQAPLLASSRLAQAIYYVVVGLGWVLPAMPLIACMQRPDPQP